jgi:iron complex transport system ATP-binding protein
LTLIASTTLLQLKDVYLEHDTATQLPSKNQSVSFNLKYGERLAILGPSGAGKTTLLKLMSLELLPKKGTVIFKDRVGRTWPLVELSSHRAVMTQDSQVAFGLEVHLVIALGRVARTSDPMLSEIVVSAARLVCVEHLLLRRCDTLSGGERARVHLARVFAQMWDVKEGLILVDEPLAALDLGLQLLILRALDAFATDRRHAIVAVLHDVNHALQAFDRLVLLKNSQLFADIPSNFKALPVFERLYDVSLESVRTSSDTLVVVSRALRN